MVDNSYNKIEITINRIITITCISVVVGGLILIGMYFKGSKTDFITYLLSRYQIISDNNYSTPNELRAERSDIQKIVNIPSCNKSIRQDTIQLFSTQRKPNTELQSKKYQIPKKVKHSLDAKTCIKRIKASIQTGEYKSACEIITKYSTILLQSKYSSDVSYLKARALTGLYSKGSVTGPVVINAWKDVKTFFSIDSNQYTEADSILILFGVK